ncbi:hypothetical protein M885DRAFT_516115 [Pelagophyceae sp. CCMP2097]|nr:hypothetical protein M885DRAFT_516115 [Pelagophyceae sp. CCMP2097]
MILRLGRTLAAFERRTAKPSGNVTIGFTGCSAVQSTFLALCTGLCARTRGEKSQTCTARRGDLAVRLLYFPLDVFGAALPRGWPRCDFYYFGLGPSLLHQAPAVAWTRERASMAVDFRAHLVAQLAGLAEWAWHKAPARPRLVLATPPATCVGSAVGRPSSGQPSVGQQSTGQPSVGQQSTGQPATQQCAPWLADQTLAADDACDALALAPRGLRRLRDEVVAVARAHADNARFAVAVHDVWALTHAQCWAAQSGGGAFPRLAHARSASLLQVLHKFAATAHYWDDAPEAIPRRKHTDTDASSIPTEHSLT